MKKLLIIVTIFLSILAPAAVAQFYTLLPAYERSSDVYNESNPHINAPQQNIYAPENMVEYIDTTDADKDGVPAHREVNTIPAY